MSVHHAELPEFLPGPPREAWRVESSDSEGGGRQGQNSEGDPRPSAGCCPYTKVPKNKAARIWVTVFYRFFWGTIWVCSNTRNLDQPKNDWARSFRSCRSWRIACRRSMRAWCARPRRDFGEISTFPVEVGKWNPPNLTRGWFSFLFCGCEIIMNRVQ